MIKVLFKIVLDGVQHVSMTAGRQLSKSNVNYTFILPMNNSNTETKASQTTLIVHQKILLS